jgi:predicted XRE-type DNA-binding protein
MIKNEKQYNITRKKLSEIDGIVKEYTQKKKLTPQHEMYLASLQMMQKRMQQEIKDYETLKIKGLQLRRKISVAQIPDILIEHKIAQHLSQKEYASILGIKEQQLQRYEAENYASVSLKKLLQFMERSNLKIELSVTAL